MQTKIINVLFLSMLILCSIAHALNAGVPAKINFQGRLEESGQAVNDTRSMIFTIYAVETGGSPVWTSQPNNVLVTNGLFSVNLETGTVSNISTDTFKGSRYIEVSVDGVTLSPRQEIISAPYALVAQALSADAKISLTNLEKNPSSLSTINLSTNAVDWSQLKNVPSGFADGADNSVDSIVTREGGVER